MIVLDTHVLIWLYEGNPKLGKSAKLTLENALKQNTLAVASISFWEISMLEQKQRLSLRLPLAQWQKDTIKHGINEIPLTSEIGITAGELAPFHGDPADRMIYATAMHYGANLMTADKKMLMLNDKLNCIDAAV